MEILERYLQAVKKYLPWQRQDDIIAELRANLEAQIEDAEAEHGRPLTSAEIEELLKKMGPPMLVAGRFQPQRSLIGPTLFPVYLYVLRIALTWATAIYAVVMAVVVPLTAPQEVDLLQAFLRYPGVLFMVAAWNTLVFAVIEQVIARHPEKLPLMFKMAGTWSPEALPPLASIEGHGCKQRTFARAAAEAIFGFLAMCWLALVPYYPFLMLGPGAAYIHAVPFYLAPIWWTFYWWIIALNIVQVGWNVLDLIRGTWQKPSYAKHLIVKTIGIVPLGLLIAVPNNAYLLLRDSTSQYAAQLDRINWSIHLSLMLVCAIVGIQFLWDVYQILLMYYRKRVAA
ncbi:MAG TPA: hypothetical protein VF392_08360 [Terracidiphilus sp.]